MTPSVGTDLLAGALEDRSRPLREPDEWEQTHA
jgi:hypothetical protein